LANNCGDTGNLGSGKVVVVWGMMDHKTLEKLRLRVVAAAALADDAADVADQAEQEHELVLLRYRRALDQMAKIRAQKKEVKNGPTVATDHDRRAGETPSQQRAADDAG
jgi:hypothetical protein